MLENKNLTLTPSNLLMRGGKNGVTIGGEGVGWGGGGGGDNFFVLKTNI